MSMLAVGAAVSFVLATGQSSGYVQYKINITNPDDPASSRTAIVNESAHPIGQTGFVDLTLSLSSTAMNLTNSKDVDSSSLPEIFPYLSGLTNQSFSYEVRGFSITANLVNTGQVPVTFNGVTYQATQYLVSFSAMNSSGMKSISAEGNIISMPSGLIYTVQLSLNQTASVNITLLSTSLRLTDPPSSVNPLSALVLGAGVIAAVGIAAPAIFKKVKHNKTNDQAQTSEVRGNQKSDSEQENGDEEKPSYWVD
jgi:hypothetical protein